MLALLRIRHYLLDDKTQFVELTRHFSGRLFDLEFISEDADAHLGVVYVLTLLAFPGLYYAMLKYQSYSHDYWQLTPASYNADALSDQCLYVFFSMVVIGVVAVLEWDRLFPDGRDYGNLMPLPLKLRTIFCAKIAALFQFVGLFILAVAGAPVLIYPLVASAGLRPFPSFQYLVWMMVVHGIAVFSGCLFMFLFFVALQGVLINLLTYTQFRGISLYVQGLATVSPGLPVFSIAADSQSAAGLGEDAQLVALRASADVVPGPLPNTAGHAQPSLFIPFTDRDHCIRAFGRGRCGHVLYVVPAAFADGI